MTAKKKQAAKQHQKRAVSNNASTDKSAELALKPSLNSAAVVAEYNELLGKQDTLSLIKPLHDSINEVVEGGMAKCQEMLIGQAHALESIFVNLARRATKQEYLKNYDVFLKLALKAQSQCRATLETLVLLKNPPIVFAQQANITQGNQQINNNPLPAGETKNATCAKEKIICAKQTIGEETCTMAGIQKDESVKLT